VQRAIEASVADGRRCALPSELLGNGVEIEPREALALREYVGGARDTQTLAERIHAVAASRQAGAQDGAVASLAARVVETLAPWLTRLGLLA
jgi:hypothetical protein